MRTLTLTCFILFLVSTVSAESLSAFKVGVMLCQTGVCAETGASSLRGVQLAAEEINASGGILGKRVELIVEDTNEAAASANAVTAFHKLLLDPEVKYFIGPTWSNGGMPLLPIIKKHDDIIITSPSLGVRDFNESSDQLFNTWPHDDESTKALAVWAWKRGLKTAGIFSAQDPWASAQAEAFKAAFERQGGKVSVIVEPLPSNIDLRAEVLKIHRANPDLLLLILWAHLTTAAKEIRSIDWNGQLLSVQMDQERMKIGGSNFEGLVFAAFAPPSNDFLSRFENRFHAKPALSADNAYDTLYLYKRAIETAQSFDAKLVKMEMLRQNFTGASGEIVFDRFGGVLRTPLLFQIRDGAARRVE